MQREIDEVLDVFAGLRLELLGAREGFESLVVAVLPRQRDGEVRPCPRAIAVDGDRAAKARFGRRKLLLIDLAGPEIDQALDVAGVQRQRALVRLRSLVQSPLHLEDDGKIDVRTARCVVGRDGVAHRRFRVAEISGTNAGPAEQRVCRRIASAARFGPQARLVRLMNPAPAVQDRSASEQESRIVGCSLQRAIDARQELRPAGRCAFGARLGDQPLAGCRVRRRRAIASPPARCRLAQRSLRLCRKP